MRLWQRGLALCVLRISASTIGNIASPSLVTDEIATGEFGESLCSSGR